MSKAHAPATVGKQGKNFSAANAKAAFTNFSLSKPATAKAGRTYIAKGEDVVAKQKSLIKRQLTDLAPTGPGLTLIISDQRALKMKDGKIDLSTLIGAMDKARQGTQFHTSGTSIPEQIEIRTQVEDFFNALKGNTNAQPK